MNGVSNAEVQKARAFLYSQHQKGFRIPPKQFAAAAKELGMGFRELLRWIAQLYARGQMQSGFRRAAIERLAKGGAR